MQIMAPGMNWLFMFTFKTVFQNQGLKGKDPPHTDILYILKVFLRTEFGDLSILSQYIKTPKFLQRIATNHFEILKLIWFYCAQHIKYLFPMMAV